MTCEIWFSDRMSLDKKGFIRRDSRILPDKETLEILERARRPEIPKEETKMLEKIKQTILR